MQLENIATPPPEPAPELRYASLHRAVERGLASDEVWHDLAQVCLTLGHDSEAIRAFKNMAEGALKNSLESILARRALIEPPVRRSRRSWELPTSGISKDPDAAALPDSPAKIGLLDHLNDALHFLLLERMPWLVLITTLAFPLVVGLGGFLTAGGSPYLLPAIAALPGLCVLGIVGALSRRILVESAFGAEDPPALPELLALASQAIRFLVDFATIAIVMLGVPALVLLTGAPIYAAAPGFLIGLVLMPMALSLRQVRDDWQALMPSVLLPAINRCGVPYLGIAAIFWVIFTPAALALMATFGMAVWLQIAVVGPLLSLPLFVSARILGTFLDAHRIPLGALLASRTPRPMPAETIVSNRRERSGQPRFPNRPAEIAHLNGPGGKKAMRARATAATGTATATAAAPATATPVNARQAQPAPRAATPATRRPAAPTTERRAAPTGSRPATPANPRPAVAPTVQRGGSALPGQRQPAPATQRPQRSEPAPTPQRRGQAPTSERNGHQPPVVGRSEPVPTTQRLGPAPTPLRKAPAVQRTGPAPARNNAPAAPTSRTPQPGPARQATPAPRTPEKQPVRAPAPVARTPLQPGVRPQATRRL